MRTKFLRLIDYLLIEGLTIESDLLQKLDSKTITKAQLLDVVQADFGILPLLLDATLSSRATVRYGCGKVLLDLSEKHPQKLYPYMNRFIALLDSKHRILTWNAMAIIANLTVVDVDCKFDALFDKYYGFLGNEYMVTVANVIVNSAKIALAKPYLTQKITNKLLKVQDLKVTQHLTQECKLVIAEQAIKTFDRFFDNIEEKEPIIAFAQKHLNSSRTSLRKEAQKFLKKRQ